MPHEGWTTDRGQGRRRASPDDVRSFQRRLRRLIKLKYGGVQRRFALECQIPESTVKGWFRQPGTIPDPTHLLHLAAETEVSLDWLLLGEGPELRGVTRPIAELATDLRRRLENELKGSSGLSRKELDRILPTGEDMVQALTRVYGSVVKSAAERKRARHDAIRQRAIDSMRGNAATDARAGSLRGPLRWPDED